MTLVRVLLKSRVQGLGFFCTRLLLETVVKLPQVCEILLSSGLKRILFYEQLVDSYSIKCKKYKIAKIEVDLKY
jgi:hypothetical protein